MSLRRSLIALLCALAALLGLPAAALAETTPPVNTTPATPAAWQTGPYVVALSGTDSGSGLDTMQWSLDGSAPIDAADGEIVTIDTFSGLHTFETIARDFDSNVSVVRVDTLRVDRILPTDSTDPGTPGWHPSPTNVQVIASDSTSGLDRVEWQLDGGMVQSGPNFSFVPISADGDHTLRTRAVDVAGNVSVWRDHTIRIDTVTPTDTTAAPAGWQTAPLQVHVTGTDQHSDIATVAWRLDGGAITTGAPPVSPIVSADGVHTLDTRVTDLAGNQTGWKSTTIRIDTTAPSNQTPASDGVWTTANYAVLVTAADSVSGLAEVQWRVNAGPWMSGASGLQASIIVPGDHALETRAIDVAGNASVSRLDNVRIDRVAPVNTTAVPPPSVVGNSHQAAVTGTDAQAGVASVEWQVDSGTVQSGASGVQATVAGHGPHTLKTRVLDAAGNASVWRNDAIAIDAITGDTTAPTDTTTTASSTWRTGPIAVTVSATDAGSGVAELRWRIDGLALATSPGASPSFTITGDGDHVLETRAIDLAGRDSGWRTQTFKIDTTVPVDTTDISVGWQSSRMFTLSGSDAVPGIGAVSGIDTIEYRINAGAVQPATNGQSIDVGADGTFTIAHRVIDLAEHASAWTTDTLRVDTVLPVNTSAVPASTWRPVALVQALSGTDDRSGLATMQWRVDGGDIQDGGPAVVDEEGVHTLETRAVDAAGNPSAWRSDTVRVDTTVPVDTTAIPTAWQHSRGFTLSGTDAVSGIAEIEYTIDGGAVQHAANNQSIDVVADGTFTITHRAIDLAGRASALTTDTLKVDMVDPANTSGVPASPWLPDALVLPLSGTDATSGLATMQWRVDGGDIQDGGAAVVDEDGVHTLETRAVDVSGLASAWRTDTFGVDTIDPVDTTIIPTAWQHAREFTLSGTDGLSGIAEIEYTIDGVDFPPATNNQSIDVGADGTFTITHRAIDLAGRASALTTDTLKVDTVDPENTSGVPASTWRPDALVLPLTGTDDTSGFATMQWRLDGGDIHDGGPAVVDEDGVHTLETRAVDVSGLKSAWQGDLALDLVRVDVTAPVNDTPEPPPGWRSTPYTVLVAGSDGNGSGVNTIAIDGVVASGNPVPVTVTGDGEHELLISIVDNVGHTSERTDTIQIDSVAPLVGLACSPASGWSSAAVTCTASANGGPSGLSSLTASQDGGADSAIADGGAVVVSADGAHVVRLLATDGAGNTASTEATVHVDRTVPTATVTCAADSGTAYACQASGADATSGVAALDYRLNGGAWTPVAAGASFAIAKGAVQVRAVDGAGNEALTGAVTLVDRVKIAKPPLLTSTSVAVHLAGHTDSKSLVGAMKATRSPTGAVSVDLRPLAVGRGNFRVEIKIRSGKRSTKVKRTVKVGKGGHLPRISGSLASAIDKCTVTLTVRKRVGHKWRRFATAKAVLAG